MAQPIEFWFEFASTYSYLSAARIEAVASAAGLEVVWRPFLLGPIFADQGWSDSPFNQQPAKGRYMWRDVERLCSGYSLEYQRPSAFPRNGLLAARVAQASLGEPWLPDFVKAVYRANFAEDRDIGQAEVIGNCLESSGASRSAAFERAEGPAGRQSLRASTDCARELGIFGAPSFVVDGELFWGNDRMGDAVAQALLGGG